MPNITYIPTEYGRILYGFYQKVFFLYGSLQLIYSPKDVEDIIFKAKDKEEMIDFLCGNKWPKFMEEFIQLIIQDLTCFN